MKILVISEKAFAFLTQNIWYLLQHKFSDSLITTQYPTIQFDSDTNCPELEPTPQVKGSVPQDGPYSRSHLKIPGCHPLFWLIGYKFGSQGQVQNLPGWFTELRKVFYLLLQVYKERIQLRTVKWERCIVNLLHTNEFCSEFIRWVQFVRNSNKVGLGSQLTQSAI